MAGNSEERNKALIGHKWNKLTLKKLAGQHPTSAAWSGEFACDCGNIVPRAMISDVKLGRKKDCGAACALRVKAAVSKPTRKYKRRVANPAENIPKIIPAQTEAAAPIVNLNLQGLGFDRAASARAFLGDAAATMRQAAVLIKHGLPGNAVDVLREQATLIDEQIYAPEV